MQLSIPSIVLEIGFQMQEFSTSAEEPLFVCLTVLSGILDTGFTVDIMVSTKQAFVPVVSATLGETGQFNLSVISVAQ